MNKILNNFVIEPEMLIDKKYWATKKMYGSQDDMIQVYIKQQIKCLTEKQADINDIMNSIALELANLLENPVLRESLSDEQYQKIFLDLLKESIIEGLIVPNQEHSILERFSSGSILNFIVKQEKESFDFTKALIMLVNPARGLSSIPDIEKKWQRINNGVYESEYSDFI